MELKGEIPNSPQGHPEVFTTHTPQDYEFPLEGFPFLGRTPFRTFLETIRPLLPHGYTTLAQLFSRVPNASSL